MELTLQLRAHSVKKTHQRSGTKAAESGIKDIDTPFEWIIKGKLNNTMQGWQHFLPWLLDHSFPVLWSQRVPKTDEHRNI